MSFELRLKKLKEQWLSIQAIREENKMLNYKVSIMKKKLRKNGQLLPKLLDQYNEMLP